MRQLEPTHTAGRTDDTMPPRPNFFIIGAMKSGSSTLYEYLAQHPQIFMSPVKEPSYFVDREALRQEWPQMERQGYWRGIEFYLELFNGAQGCNAIGEASTNYSKLPLIQGVPEKIFKFNPSARFIYIMRDPVQRTISHYWHNVRVGSERSTIEKAIRSNEHYRDVSYYAMQLRPYFDLFGRERVKLMTFETLRDSPRSVLPDLFEWLGVDPGFFPQDWGTAYNPTPKEILKVRGFGLLERFRYSGLWSAVGPLVPPRVRAIGRRLSRAPVKPVDVPRQSVIEFLRPIQIEQTEELAQLVGRRFPEWTTLYGQ